MMNLDLSSIEENPLWPILVETVHSITMYIPHKRYISELIEKEVDTDPETLSLKLGITLGEALVILKELEKERVKHKES